MTTKQEFIDAIATQTEQPKKLVTAIIDALGDVAAAALVSGEEITLPGLGKLYTDKRAARKGRNPATGEPIDIAAKTVVKFGIAKALRDKFE